MQPAFANVVALVALPFVAAAFVPVVSRLLGERTAYYGAAVAAVCLGLVASQYGARGSVGVPWIPTLGGGVELGFYVDGLALLIGFLASGIGVLVFVYSAGYMHGEDNLPRYYAALLAFMGSMLGVAFAGDLIALFVFWELTSVTSFVLIGHYRRRPRSRYAARKALLITVVGGLFMLVGFLALHSVTGTFDLGAMLAEPEAVRADLRSAGLFVPVLGLLGVGAAAKSAQVPLHVWLPDAMEAPTPVSTFLHSATMVKAGVYLVGRFRPLLEGPEWTALFVGLGLLTMFVAAALAVAATDTKELLAYSTASHLGLIIAGFGFTQAAGVAAAGAEAGSFHVLNHALFKAPLFLVAGILAHEAGTRNIDELGGLWRDLPVVAAVTVVAALGMAGIPPFNGFYSKELLFEATYEAALHLGGPAWLLPVVAVLGSVFTVCYSLRFLMLFFGERPEALGEVHRPPLAMLAPAALLGGLALLVGLAPRLATGAIVDAVFAGVGGHGAVHAGLPTHVTAPALMSAVTVLGGLGAYTRYGRLNAWLRRAASGPRTVDFYYDRSVAGLERLGAAAVGTTQTGLLRTYVSWTMGAVAALAVAGYLVAGVGLPAIGPIGLSTPLLVILVVAGVGALAVGRAPSHIAGVLTLSILGFMVAIVYVLASAPDLALTQLVVETLVLVIFLLVLDRLPAYYGEALGARAVRDAALSVAVGATVTVTVLLTTARMPGDGISDFFVQNAVPRGGGGNVVNVILVDFRALDTMGEISVIGIAGLSVLTLLAMRDRGGSQG